MNDSFLDVVLWPGYKGMPDIFIKLLVKVDVNIFDNTYCEPSKQALAKKLFPLLYKKNAADFEEPSYFFGRFCVHNK